MATTPASIDVQPSAFAIATGQSSTLVAVVRDAPGNLVKNQTVVFTLVDVTGGTLSVGSAVTDSQGRALDDWQFTRGAPVRLQDRLKSPVEIPGRSLDFSEAGLGVPVVHVRVATVFAELAPDDVQ